MFWSRLGWPYNPPVLDENGNARMMLSDDSPEKKFHGDFDRAGIKIHSTILFSGWIASGKYEPTRRATTSLRLSGKTPCTYRA